MRSLDQRIGQRNRGIACLCQRCSHNRFMKPTPGKDGELVSFATLPRVQLPESTLNSTIEVGGGQTEILCETGRLSTYTVTPF
jgi:hypothetical protein